MSTAGEHSEGDADVDPKGPDIVLSLDRSREFFLVRPVTERGRSWVRRNIPAAARTPEGEMVIAPNFASDLAAWVRADGLSASLGARTD